MPDYTIVGGELHSRIVLTFTGSPPVSEEDIASQAVRHESAGLPDLGAYKPKGRRLAVVGGGPSIHEKLDQIRAWDGDIWAVNSVWHFLKAKGIASTFFALDPHEIVADWAKNVTKALVASRVHPRVVDELNKASADYAVFSIDNGYRIKTGSSTATAAIHLAVHYKYEDLTLFGCESSYMAHRTHAHMHEVRPKQMIVSCNGEQFLTAPDYLVQAIELACIIRECPSFIKEESGGLLRAMIQSPEYEPVWISQDIADNINPKLEPDPLPSGVLIREVK